MTVSPAFMNKIPPTRAENLTGSAPRVVRAYNLSQKIVMLDGLPGSGKTLVSPLLSSLKRTELLSYSFETEFICRLGALGKIDPDAVIAMIRMLIDHKMYEQMMGRNLNFRYSDLSSPFKAIKPLRYFRRIFQKGDEVVPELIRAQQPILNVVVHDMTRVCDYLFSALGARLVFVRVIRHPLLMLVQQFLNLERLLQNPRDIQVCFEYKEEQLPYFAYGWESKFCESNNIDRTIYSIEWMLRESEGARERLKPEHKKSFVQVPFEKLVIDPVPYIDEVAGLLQTEWTRETKKVMKKQKVPRENIFDGLDLPIYRRSGWEPSQSGLSEREEFLKRREFAIAQGATNSALEVLDSLCQDYESKWQMEPTI
jgi:hypothetical protein